MVISLWRTNEVLGGSDEALNDIYPYSHGTYFEYQIRLNGISLALQIPGPFLQKAFGRDTVITHKYSGYLKELIISRHARY